MFGSHGQSVPIILERRCINIAIRSKMSVNSDRNDDNSSMLSFSQMFNVQPATVFNIKVNISGHMSDWKHQVQQTHRYEMSLKWGNSHPAPTFALVSAGHRRMHCNTIHVGVFQLWEIATIALRTGCRSIRCMYCIQSHRCRVGEELHCFYDLNVG